MGFFGLKTTNISGALPTTPTTSPNIYAGTGYKRLLPQDRSALTGALDPCHCVSDLELENRYNLLRSEEHARMEGKCGPEWSRSESLVKNVSDRNRYNTITTWNHSRVKLPVQPGYPDYINASWIQLGSRAYIATQGPLPSTVTDFWHMVYAYGGDPAVIIMLTACYEHAMEKCAKYWPDTKEDSIHCAADPSRGYPFGLDIHLERIVPGEQYSYSTFKLIPTDSKMPTRHVHHVYYHTWLDYSKPNADADLRALIYLVNNKLRNRGAPPIVHCSAGIGRTGTFIAVDALISMIDHGIELPMAPKHTPVWSTPAEAYWYKTTPFTGPQDSHAVDPSEDVSSKVALRSKFDISSSTSRANSIRTSPPTTETQATTIDEEDGKLKQLDKSQSTQEISPATKPVSNGDAKSGPVLNGQFKIDSPSQNSIGPKSSLLTQAIKRHEEQKKTEEESKDDEGLVLGIDSKGQSECTNGECPASIGSALSGPPIKHIAVKTTNVSEDVLRETPANIDVSNWFDPEDPVMSTVRCMRKQRPKMVQGKQQLGYIYDQLEVAQQFARVYSMNGSTPSSLNSPSSLRRNSTLPASYSSSLSSSTKGQLSRDQRSLSASNASSSSPENKGKGIKGLLRSRSIVSVLNPKTQSHTSPSAASTRR